MTLDATLAWQTSLTIVLVTQSQRKAYRKAKICHKQGRDFLICFLPQICPTEPRLFVFPRYQRFSGEFLCRGAVRNINLWRIEISEKRAWPLCHEYHDLSPSRRRRERTIESREEAFRLRLLWLTSPWAPGESDFDVRLCVPILGLSSPHGRLSDEVKWSGKFVILYDEVTQLARTGNA